MIPPLVISFLVPITDRYLFLPSVGACLLLAFAITEAAKSFPSLRWPLWLLVAALGTVWCVKTWNYVEEWRDPRSVWYGAHLKTKNSQVSQFLAEVYHGTAERINEFIKSGTALQVTNETKIARAVLGDDAPVERMQAEWRGTTSTRTNSAAYRDELWRLAWEQYQESVAHRGTLSAPNLFINRGRLLIGKGEYDKAIPEFQTALRFAQDSTYDVVRQETVIHAMRGIGVAYWSKRDYRAAKDWYLKAQDVQKKSGHAWISTLDDEVVRITALANGQP
jgi:tetratricopeptide (TPR) repeat protein